MTYVVLEDVVAEEDCPLDNTNPNAIPIYLSMVFLARWSTREVTVSLDWFLKESRRIFNYVSEFFKSSRMKFIKVLRDICNSAKQLVYSILFLAKRVVYTVLFLAKRVVYTILFLAKRVVYTVLVFVLRNWKRLVVGAILLAATVYMFTDVHLSTVMSGVVGGGATMKTSKEKENNMQKGTYVKAFFMKHGYTYNVDVYENTRAGLTVRPIGIKREEASLVVTSEGRPILAENAMRDIAHNRDHSFALVKGDELRVISIFDADGNMISAKNEDYAGLLKDTLGITVPPKPVDLDNPMELDELMQPGCEHLVRNGYCWEEVDKLWKETCHKVSLGQLINIEWIMMWTWGKLLKKFRINQSDAIDGSQQAAGLMKLAKYLSRVFRDYRYWTFDTIRTAYLKSHKDIDLAEVCDGHVGALSLHIARHVCGMGKKIHVGDIVEITYFTSDGLLKGLAEVVPNNMYEGIDFLLYGDQWKSECSYAHSFLGVDRKAGNDYVKLESQTLGNIIPFRDLAKGWAKRFIDGVTKKIVSGDIMAALGALRVLGADEDDLRKSSFILKRLALHEIPATVPYAVNRIWSFLSKQLLKAGELRVEIPGSIRRIATPDITKINCKVGDIKAGNVVIKGDMILFSRKDGMEIMLCLGDGDYDDPIIIHHLKGGKVLHNDNGDECGWQGEVLLHRQPNQWGEWIIVNAKSDHVPSDIVNVDMSDHFHKPEPFAKPELAIKSIPDALFQYIEATKEGVEKALRSRIPGKWRNKLHYVDGPYTALFSWIKKLLVENEARVIRYVDGLRLPDWMHEPNDFLSVAMTMYWDYAKSMAIMLTRSDKKRKAGMDEQDIAIYETRTRNRINANIRGILNKFTHAEKRLIVANLFYICYVQMPGSEVKDKNGNVVRIRNRMNDGVMNIPGPKCGHKGHCKCFTPDGRFYEVEGVRDVVIDVLISHGLGCNVEPMSADQIRLANSVFLDYQEGVDYQILDTVDSGLINSTVFPMVAHTKVRYFNNTDTSSRRTVHIRGGWVQLAKREYPDTEVADLTPTQVAKLQKTFNDLLPDFPGKGMQIEVNHNKLFCQGVLLAWLPKGELIADGCYVLHKVHADTARVLVVIDPVTYEIREGEGLGSPLPEPTKFSVVGLYFGDVDPETLHVGDGIHFLPEPNNPKDPNAIAVYMSKRHLTDRDDRKLGYIPAKHVDEFKRSDWNKPWLTADISNIARNADNSIAYVNFK
jgi:hypothetical protein